MLQLVSDFFRPLALLALSAAFAVLTFAQSVAKLDFATLTSLGAFKDKSFANLWLVLGRLSYTGARPHVAPLLPRAKGCVLDIGTGTGHWLEFYDRTKLKKLYCVEPNKEHHAKLWNRAKETGLDEVIEIVSARVESLEDAGIEKGSIDTVVTVQVLCSIYDPDTMVKELYTYLKPSGQWIMFEHVKTPHSGLVSIYQALLNLLWPHMFNGCSLRQETGRSIQNAGTWASSMLRAPADESTTTAIPHVLGVLKKQVD